jgi:hypothetical protein
MAMRADIADMLVMVRTGLLTVGAVYLVGLALGLIS